MDIYSLYNIPHTANTDAISAVLVIGFIAWVIYEAITKK